VSGTLIGSQWASKVTAVARLFFSLAKGSRYSHSMLSPLAEQVGRALPGIVLLTVTL
jgi:hypothetical protein